MHLGVGQELVDELPALVFRPGALLGLFLQLQLRIIHQRVVCRYVGGPACSAQQLIRHLHSVLAQCTACWLASMANSNSSTSFRAWAAAVLAAEELILHLPPEMASEPRSLAAQSRLLC